MTPAERARKFEQLIQEMKRDFESRQKANRLSSRSTEVMLRWFVSHLVVPYPTADEKKALARESGLDKTQIRVRAVWCAAPGPLAANRARRCDLPRLH